MTPPQFSKSVTITLISAGMIVGMHQYEIAKSDDRKIPIFIEWNESAKEGAHSPEELELGVLPFDVITRVSSGVNTLRQHTAQR